MLSLEDHFAFAIVLFLLLMLGFFFLFYGILPSLGLTLRDDVKGFGMIVSALTSELLMLSVVEYRKTRNHP
jgi:hypothetical protein